MCFLVAELKFHLHLYFLVSSVLLEFCPLHTLVQSGTATAFSENIRILFLIFCSHVVFVTSIAGGLVE